MTPISKRALASPAARTLPIQVSLLVLCTLLTLNALAFNTSLQPEEVQDAYSLGKTSSHQELSDFLKQYEHDFSYPNSQSIAVVQSVEFQTPYEQIVLRALRTTGYSKFQAAEDYQADPGRVIVRVAVSLKTGYNGPEPSAESFKVVVSQAKPIDPRRRVATVLCDPYTSGGDCPIYVREILLYFDAEQFAPGRAIVKVVLPSGESQETKYNLDRLK
jgi:hypothetical protein